MNVDPPLDDISGDTDAFALTAKSEARPVVGPVEPATNTVQSMGTPARAGKMLPQMRVDAAVGVPNTTNDGNSWTSGALLARTAIANADVIPEGVVENTNVFPPSEVTSGDVSAPDDTKKSPTSPVVGPPTPDTEIVHTMSTPTRAGLVFVQAIVDALVGFP